MATKWPPMELRGRPVTEDEIRMFEQRRQIVLPACYRAFLVEVNGGRPADEACVFKCGVVNGLFTLGDAKESRNLEVRSSRGYPALPSRDLLYVGYDGTGGTLLVALSDGHAGEVWYHTASDPRPEDANPRVEWHDRRDMTKLADDWEQFMASLGPLGPPPATSGA